MGLVLMIVGSYGIKSDFCIDNVQAHMYKTNSERGTVAPCLETWPTSQNERSGRLLIPARLCLCRAPPCSSADVPLDASYGA